MGDFWRRLIQARNGYVAFNEDELQLIADCEKRGYVFERHPYYGLKWILGQSRDFWCKEECEAWYEEVGLTLPWHTEIFTSTGSTNDEAWAGLNQKPTQCGVYLAEEQTHGRGRRGRHWDSISRGGIYVSLGLSMDKILLPVSLLTLGVGVAVLNALKPWVSGEVKLKWPNDVLVNRKKICGILTERQILQHGIEAIVVGIGVNVYQRPGDWTGEVSEVATSLCLCSKPDKPIRRAEILARIIKECEFVFSLDAANARDRWSRNCLDVGKWVNVVQDQRQFSGQLIGIDFDGALILKGEAGSLQKIYSGDCMI